MNILEQIESARRSLLDLSMRNRLLNYRPNKSRSIRVVDELPNEVYEILVANEKGMEFFPKKEEELKFDRNGEEAADSTESAMAAGQGDNEDVSAIWTLPSDQTPIGDNYTDKYLQTSLDEDSLQKRLFYINQQAVSVLEEQGYSVLFLALGFLQWKESPDSVELRKAPLVLVPVALERAGVQKAFRLRWTSEEVFANISLVEKLKDLGVYLPPFEAPEDKSGFEEYLESVNKLVKEKNDWQVLADICLDFFSFTKFVMYKDLDPDSWPSANRLLEHHLLKELLDPSSQASSIAGFSPNDMDQKLAMKDLYHIMDADPYQVAVLEDIKSGMNLVVEGPPGTGKSQTIANAIAELLAVGKSVLFLSEKMAALEVVKSRLDNVGLGRFCLEIHSRKASKKDVLQELERSTLEGFTGRAKLENEIEEIELVRKDLNNYVRTLGEPIGKIARSPYSLFQMKVAAEREFLTHKQSMPRVTWENVGLKGQSEWNDATLFLREFKEIASLVVPIRENPWNGTNPGVVLPSDEEQIHEKIKTSLRSLAKLRQQLELVHVGFGTNNPLNTRGVEQLIKAAEFMVESPKVEKEVLSNADWDGENLPARLLLKQLAECQSMIANALKKFKKQSLDENIVDIHAKYKTQQQRHVRFLTVEWWKLVKRVRSLYEKNAPWSSKVILTDLDELIRAIDARTKVRNESVFGRLQFGKFWRAEGTIIQELQIFADWIVTFRSFLNSEVLSKKALDVMSSNSGKPGMKLMIRALVDSHSVFVQERNLLLKKLSIDCSRMFGASSEEVTFDVLESRLHLFERSIGRLQKWSQYVVFSERGHATMAGPVIDLLEKDEVGPENLIACFSGNFADNLLHIAFQEKPELQAFIGDLHEKKIVRFSQLDTKIIEENRFRLLSKLEENKPQLIGGAPKGSEVGILLGEFGRKRGHMPIRQLIRHCGHLIQKIKPCFMMSPLSVAQFLEPQTIDFDVILFDEASQVRPQDALGALLRGKQLVVMGDTRQLPPTSFFDSVVEGDNEEKTESAEANVSDVESILHQCKRSFPSKLLSWHYRSRHETLIAVSNREFYENRLLTFPSAFDKIDSLGLHFIHLPNSVYDRGRSSINREEAREVAKAAVEHYRRFPEKSLGVGAFNIRQQQAILEEIELQLIENRNMEDLFSSSRHEHFFVKNLETIQGDERDVIFISVGFGFDENHKLSHHFGPINHAGGERRLNVLATRAREKCVVFANFRATDLVLDENSPFGLRALKTFLTFAEERTFPRDELSLVDSDSPFEDSVCEFLTENSYQVRKQVGCASFRIDIGVLDPRSPGIYLAAIECDGAKYHTAPVARDRDRLRQQVLEGLGWHIIRIWSTDWYRNRADSQSRLLKSLDSLLSRAEKEKKTTDPPKQRTDETSSQSDKNDVANNGATKMNGFKLRDLVPPYECCTSLGSLGPKGELHRQSMNKLSIAVTQVVDIESPVHKDEVIRRIRTLWGLARTGERIQEAIANGISYAVRKNQIRRKGEFLFSAAERPIVVRRREEDPPPRIELISDDEIAEGLKLVIKHLFSVFMDDLIVQTSRLLGIQATHDVSATRIEKIVERMIHSGEIVQLSNGMLSLTTSK